MEHRPSGVSSTVMTFNLRRESVLDGAHAWPFRKRSAAAAILGAAADIVGTQEGFRPMLQELAALLPGYGWIGEGRNRARMDEHNAIFYRESEWTPESHGTFWLSETPDRPGSLGWGAKLPRICTWAVLRSKRSGAAHPASRLVPPCVIVCNTHLDHRSGEARVRGLDLAAHQLDQLRQRYAAPAVLLGDFNAPPGSEAIAQLERRHLASAYERDPGSGAAAVGGTFHQFQGDAKAGAEPIDYIFLSGEWTVLSITVDRNRYEGKFPSDHYPVVAALSWDSRGASRAAP